jgi:hypothetical protein
MFYISVTVAPKNLFLFNLRGKFMEHEKNSENWDWAQSDGQAQPGSSPQPEKKSDFQQESPQQARLNIKDVPTWLACLIVVAVLCIAAALIAPKFGTAQLQQEETSDYYSEYEYDAYDEYECYEYQDNWSDESECSEYEDNWYSEPEYEDNWYDEYYYED